MRQTFEEIEDGNEEIDELIYQLSDARCRHNIPYRKLQGNQKEQ